MFGESSGGFIWDMERNNSEATNANTMARAEFHSGPRVEEERARTGLGVARHWQV